MNKRTAIIGEYYNNFKPHYTLMESIEHVKKKHKVEIGVDWVGTLQAQKEGTSLFASYSGFWSAPGSTLLLNLRETNDCEPVA